MGTFIYMWKVVGFSGLKLISTEVWATDVQRARSFAMRRHGMWLVLRVIPAGVVEA